MLDGMSKRVTRNFGYLVATAVISLLGTISYFGISLHIEVHFGQSDKSLTTTASTRKCLTDECAPTVSRKSSQAKGEPLTRR